jgi:hypothetical protein
MMVPFSNGERAVNRVYQHKFNKLMEELDPSKTTVGQVPLRRIRRLDRKGIEDRSQRDRLKSENYRN